MRLCLHPSHRTSGEPAWILDTEPNHYHEKPRLRLVDGEWVEVPKESADNGTA